MMAHVGLGKHTRGVCFDASLSIVLLPGKTGRFRVQRYICICDGGGTTFATLMPRTRVYLMPRLLIG